MHLYTSRVSTRLYRIAQGVHSMVDQVCSGYTRRLTSRRHVHFNVFESIAFPSVTAYERESNSPVPDDVDLDILGVLQSSASNTMCFWIVEKIAFIDCFADCYRYPNGVFKRLIVRAIGFLRLERPKLTYFVGFYRVAPDCVPFRRYVVIKLKLNWIVDGSG